MIGGNRVKKQLQGLALILFGILLTLIAMVDPWIPIIEGIAQPLLLFIGFLLGIIGLCFSFKEGEV